MLKKLLYYISALAIGVVLYFVMSHDIDLKKDTIGNSKQLKEAYLKGKEIFNNSFKRHAGYFEEEDYVEFAICTHSVAGGRFEVFGNVYTNRYKMLLVYDDNYRIYSEGDYIDSLDNENKFKYLVFRSDPIDYSEAYYRYGGAIRATGTIFTKEDKDEIPVDLIVKYLSDRGSKKLKEIKNFDREWSGIDSFHIFTEIDMFYEKWFFMDEKDSFRDLRRNVDFSKDFGSF